MQKSRPFCLNGIAPTALGPLSTWPRADATCSHPMSPIIISLHLPLMTSSSRESAEIFSKAPGQDVADDKVAKRVVGISKFIGELYIRDLVSQAFVVLHVSKLLHCGQDSLPTATQVCRLHPGAVARGSQNC